MTDGADYPGYPEPEPDTESQPEIDTQTIWRKVNAHLLAIFLASGKMVTSAFLGALFAVELSRSVSDGPPLEGMMFLYILVTGIFVFYHALEIVVKWFLSRENQ